MSLLANMRLRLLLFLSRQAMRDFEWHDAQAKRKLEAAARYVAVAQAVVRAA